MNNSPNTLTQQDRDRTGVLLAPNGKPSNLTPELYAYVRTQEFKQWFGDWLLPYTIDKSYEKGKKLLDHSRILDENGEPLVLYRGQWSHANVPFVNHGDGIYFTPERHAAIGYGMDHDPIPVFLNARNPYEVDFEGDPDTEENDNHADIKSEYHYARKENFDILIATNTFDGENNLDQYVVHEDAQIKRIDLLNLKKVNQNDLYTSIETTPENPKMNNQPTYQLSGEQRALLEIPLTPLTQNDIVLRDKLITLMRNAGINVNTNWQEGQAILDAANSQIKLMSKRENKKTTTSERSGAVAGNPSSDSLQYDVKERLSRHALDHHIDIAKIQKNTEKTKKLIRKIKNEGLLDPKQNDPSGITRFISKKLNIRKSRSSQSYYGDYFEGDYHIGENRTVRVRLSTHPATGERLGNAPTDDKISLVVYKNGEHHTTGHGYGEYSEWIYDPQKMSGEQIARQIINGIDNLLNKGEYIDPSITPIIYPSTDTRDLITQAQANDSYLKAPNGNDSALNETQWAQVRTDAFKTWFGDWQKPAIFTAFNVDDVNALKGKYPSTLPNKYYQHSTNNFGLQPFDSREGKKEKLHIIGRLTTDKVDCLLVENPFSDNKYPHITLATAKGVKPVESNAEIERNQDKIQPLDDYVNTTFKNNLNGYVSKLIDKNGEPMVLYHGTNVHFNTFEPHEGLRWHGWGEQFTANAKGFFFSDNFDDAKKHAHSNATMKGGEEIVMPVYVSMKNPADLSGDGKNDIEELFHDLTGYYPLEHPDYHQIDQWWRIVEDEEFDIPVRLKELGYDGIIFAEKTNEYTGITEEKSYYVTNPNQIKSATLNNGEFSLENNDIRFQLADSSSLSLPTQQPIYISNALLALQKIKQERATPDQWLAMLQKQGGIKQGEDRWTGLSEWLLNNDEKVLTRQQIADFIAENQIRIEETHYMELEESPQFKDLYEEFLKHIDEVHENYEQADRDYADFMEEMAQKYGPDFDYDHDLTLEEWQEAGNLLDERDMCDTNINPAEEQAFQLMVDIYGETFDEAFAHDRDEFYINDSEKATEFFGNKIKEIDETRLRFTTQELDNKREIALTVPTIDSYNAGDAIHFGDADEGRAIAWARFGDATMPHKDTEDEINIKISKLPKPEDWEKVDGSNFVNKHDCYFFPKTRNLPGHSYISKDDQGLFHINGPMAKRILVDKSLHNQFESLNEAVNTYNRLWVTAKQNTTYDKILVIDEIQSKRHQEGREKGYIDSNAVKELKSLEAEENKAIRERDKYHQYLMNLYGLERPTNFLIGDLYEINNLLEKMTTQEEKQHYLSLKNHVIELNNKKIEFQKQNHQSPEAVPAAPFEHNWHELAMKRMLRYAAENGYDRVAWTTGTQQAERYDIGGIADNIVVGDNMTAEELNEHFGENDKIKEDGKTVSLLLSHNNKSYDLAVNNKGVITYCHEDERMDGKKLADLVGKKLADNIMQSFNQTLSGENIHVGDEGMRSFYDQIIPNFINKYTKKWNTHTEDITIPKLSEHNTSMTFHSVPVTPQMRQDVMQGQPMFFLTPQGDAYGFTKDNSIFIDPRIATSETPIHEYAHLWAAAMRQYNTNEWDNIVNLMKRVRPVWKMVQSQYSHLKTDSDIAEEVLAQYSGKQGIRRLTKDFKNFNKDITEDQAEGILARIKEAIDRFWQKTADFLHIHYESADQVASRVMHDLLHQVNPQQLVTSVDVPSVALQTQLQQQPKADNSLDTAYLEAVKRGDLETAQQMVNAQAMLKRYSLADIERDGHTAPGAEIDQKDFQNLDQHAKSLENGADVNLYAIANGISPQPDDYFTHPMAARWYMYDDKAGREAQTAINTALRSIQYQMRHDGEVTNMPEVTVYRAVPKEVQEDHFRRNGEWVSPSLSYTIAHGEHRLGIGEYRIISEKIPADQLWWDGNDIREWGVDDGRSYAFRNTKNNAKLLDPVTYDDQGNVIPLSQRFNPENTDIRFQLAGQQGATRLDTIDHKGRIENLHVARQMERENRSPKEIKIATGWERGIDRKWRYEFPDIQLNTDTAIYQYALLKEEFHRLNNLNTQRGFRQADRIRQKYIYMTDKETSVGEILSPKSPILMAYPQFADIKLAFEDSIYLTAKGSYNDTTKTLMVNKAKIKDTNDLRETLAHELQHAIQHAEGFALGANINNKDIKLNQDLDLFIQPRLAINYMHNNAYKFPTSLEMIKAAKDDAANLKDRCNIDALIELINKGSITIDDVNRYADGGYRQYRASAGEVEARNVQTRLHRSPFINSRTTAASTEDVPREQQTVNLTQVASFQINDQHIPQQKTENQNTNNMTENNIQKTIENFLTGEMLPNDIENFLKKAKQDDNLMEKIEEKMDQRYPVYPNMGFSENEVEVKAKTVLEMMNTLNINEIYSWGGSRLVAEDRKDLIWTKNDESQKTNVLDLPKTFAKDTLELAFRDLAPMMEKHLTEVLRKEENKETYTEPIPLTMRLKDDDNNYYSSIILPEKLQLQENGEITIKDVEGNTFPIKNVEDMSKTLIMDDIVNLSKTRNDEIERYLAKQMSPEEQKLFEKEMEENPSLKFDTQLLAAVIVKTRENEREKERDLINKMRDEAAKNDEYYNNAVKMAEENVQKAFPNSNVTVPHPDTDDYSKTESIIIDGNDSRIAVGVVHPDEGPNQPFLFYDIDNMENKSMIQLAKKIEKDLPDKIITGEDGYAFLDFQDAMNLRNDMLAEHADNLQKELSDLMAEHLMKPNGMADIYFEPVALHPFPYDRFDSDYTEEMDGIRRNTDGSLQMVHDHFLLNSVSEYTPQERITVLSHAIETIQKLNNSLRKDQTETEILNYLRENKTNMLVGPDVETILNDGKHFNIQALTYDDANDKLMMIDFDSGGIEDMAKAKTDDIQKFYALATDEQKQLEIKENLTKQVHDFLSEKGPLATIDLNGENKGWKLYIDSYSNSIYAEEEKTKAAIPVTNLKDDKRMSMLQNAAEIIFAQQYERTNDQTTRQQNHLPLAETQTDVQSAAVSQQQDTSSTLQQIMAEVRNHIENAFPNSWISLSDPLKHDDSLSVTIDGKDTGITPVVLPEGFGKDQSFAFVIENPALTADDKFWAIEMAIENPDKMEVLDEQKIMFFDIKDAIEFKNEIQKMNTQNNEMSNDNSDKLSEDARKSDLDTLLQQAQDALPFANPQWQRDNDQQIEGAKLLLYGNDSGIRAEYLQNAPYDGRKSELGFAVGKDINAANIDSLTEIYAKQHPEQPMFNNGGDDLTVKFLEVKQAMQFQSFVNELVNAEPKLTAEQTQNMADIRERYPDTIILNRNGGNYESYGKDAERISSLLELPINYDRGFAVAQIEAREIDGALIDIISKNHHATVVDDKELSIRTQAKVMNEIGAQLIETLGEGHHSLIGHPPTDKLPGFHLATKNQQGFMLISSIDLSQDKVPTVSLNSNDQKSSISLLLLPLDQQQNLLQYAKALNAYQALQNSIDQTDAQKSETSLNQAPQSVETHSQQETTAQLINDQSADVSQQQQQSPHTAQPNSDDDKPLTEDEIRKWADEEGLPITFDPLKNMRGGFKEFGLLALPVNFSHDDRRFMDIDGMVRKPYLDFSENGSHQPETMIAPMSVEYSKPEDSLLLHGKNINGDYVTIPLINSENLSKNQREVYEILRQQLEEPMTKAAMHAFMNHHAAQESLTNGKVSNVFIRQTENSELVADNGNRVSVGKYDHETKQFFVSEKNELGHIVNKTWMDDMQLAQMIANKEMTAIMKEHLVDPTLAYPSLETVREKNNEQANTTKAKLNDKYLNTVLSYNEEKALVVDVHIQPKSQLNPTGIELSAISRYGSNYLILPDSPYNEIKQTGNKLDGIQMEIERLGFINRFENAPDHLLDPISYGRVTEKVGPDKQMLDGLMVDFGPNHFYFQQTGGENGKYSASYEIQNLDHSTKIKVVDMNIDKVEEIMRRELSNYDLRDNQSHSLKKMENLIRNIIKDSAWQMVDLTDKIYNIPTDKKEWMDDTEKPIMDVSMIKMNNEGEIILHGPGGPTPLSALDETAQFEVMRRTINDFMDQNLDLPVKQQQLLQLAKDRQAVEIIKPFEYPQQLFDKNDRPLQIGAAIVDDKITLFRNVGDANYFLTTKNAEKDTSLYRTDFKDLSPASQRKFLDGALDYFYSPSLQRQVFNEMNLLDEQQQNATTLSFSNNMSNKNSEEKNMKPDEQKPQVDQQKADQQQKPITKEQKENTAREQSMDQIRNAVGDDRKVKLNDNERISLDTNKGNSINVQTVSVNKNNAVSLYGEIDGTKKSVSATQLPDDSLSKLASHLDNLRAVKQTVSAEKPVEQKAETPAQQATQQPQQNPAQTKEQNAPQTVDKAYETAIKTKNDNAESNVVLVQRTNDKSTYYQAFGEDAQKIADVIKQLDSVKNKEPKIINTDNNKDLMTISVANNDMGKIEQAMRDLQIPFKKVDIDGLPAKEVAVQEKNTAQQKTAQEQQAEQKKERKVEPIEIKPDSKVEFSVVPNKVLDHVYDIQLYVDGQKQGKGHHLSLQDRKAFFDQKTPEEKTAFAASLLPKYFEKELAGQKLPDNIQRHHAERKQDATEQKTDTKQAQAKPSEQKPEQQTTAEKQQKEQTFPKYTPQEVFNVYQKVAADDKVSFVQRPSEKGNFYTSYNKDAEKIAQILNRETRPANMKEYPDVKYITFKQDEAEKVLKNLNQGGDKINSVNMEGKYARVLPEPQAKKADDYSKYQMPEEKQVDKYKIWPHDGKVFMNAEVNGNKLPMKEISWEDRNAHKEGKATIEQLVAKHYSPAEIETKREQSQSKGMSR